MLNVPVLALSRGLCAALFSFHAITIAASEPVSALPEGALVQDMKRAALARLKGSAALPVAREPVAADSLVPEVPSRGVAASQASLPSAAQALDAPAVERTPAAEPAPTAAESKRAATAAQGWSLSRGVPVHQQLAEWGERGGWTVRWQPTVSWLVAADAEFDGSFSDAISQVIDSLFFEGKPVRLVLWENNHVAEVISSDVR